MNNIYKKTPLKYNHYLLICMYTLIPLMIYGFYKNGISLYFKGLVSLIYITKPLLIILIGFISSYIISIIFKLKEGRRPLIFYNLLISLCLSINTNLILYAIAIVILNILYALFLRKIKINYVALAVLVISLLSYLIKDYSFYNHYEVIKNHSYGIFDFLFGHSIGGFGATNIILTLISLGFMSFLPYYKKDIAITGLIIYFICSLWGFVLGYNFNEIINLFCSYSVIFAITYIAPINEYSPKLERYRFIYIAVICLITFILVFFFNNVLAVFIGILFTDLLIFLGNLLRKKGN